MTTTTLGDLHKEYRKKAREAGIDVTYEIREIFYVAFGILPARLIAVGDMPVDRSKSDPLFERFLKGEPIAYVLGTECFMHEEYKVGKGVLIPRPDTETLVIEAAEYLIKHDIEDPLIYDLCTGTGCVGISLQNYLIRQGIHPVVVLVEKFDDALRYTNINISQSLEKDNISIIQADILDEGFVFEKVPDLIVSNPPYISLSDMRELDPSVKDYEPETALYGLREDGLLFYEKISRFEVTDRGAIFVEHGYDQGEAVSRIFAGAGYKHVGTIKDLGGNPRVTFCHNSDIID